MLSALPLKMSDLMHAAILEPAMLGLTCGFRIFDTNLRLRRRPPIHGFQTCGFLTDPAGGVHICVKDSTIREHWKL